MPPPPRIPAPTPVWPGVEQRRQPRLGNRLVENVCAAVVREEFLQRRMEFEALDPEVADQPPCLARAHAPFRRIDAGECDHHVAVLGRELGDLLVGDSLLAARPLAVDREDHAADIARAIIGRDLRYGGPIRGSLEVFGHGLGSGLPKLIHRLARGYLRMGVNINRSKLCQVHARGSSLPLYASDPCRVGKIV